MGDLNQEPSMEEILASIKRVIAEDGRAAVVRPSRAARAGEPTRLDEDVLELSDPVTEGDGLVSPDAAEASRQSLAALSLLRERSEEAAPLANAGPLEAVVREMLKPMLKDWLDRNLPEMVEELVTREIVRITGKNL
jgi:cell pole-organizing protein PopZ